MQELLYLVHRIPFPPNKGDKIRSYNLLKYLSHRHRVHLGTFIDDEPDWEYVDKVKALCGETCFIKLDPKLARLRSLTGLFSGSPLSLAYYRSAQLQSWVDHLLLTRPIKSALVFSSPMAQFLDNATSLRRVIDFVDVDSYKWSQYGHTKPWPLSWVYRHESRSLLAYERKTASSFDSATFVTDAEADLFKKFAPESAETVRVFNNGVDADYFSPDVTYPTPYQKGTIALVFTGAMDYWANVEAVDWFARSVFPSILTRLPNVKFYIVGARPAPQVMALASRPGITVTGTVPDVRPYIAHAALAVAPLRIARGVQNKVLEAMAMAKSVVASPYALEGISAVPGQEIFVCESEQDFSRQIIDLLQGGINTTVGLAARDRILRDYSWTNNLGRVDALLFPQHEDGAAVHAFPETQRKRSGG